MEGVDRLAAAGLAHRTVARLSVRVHRRHARVKCALHVARRAVATDEWPLSADEARILGPVVDANGVGARVAIGAVGSERWHGSLLAIRLRGQLLNSLVDVVVLFVDDKRRPEQLATARVELDLRGGQPVGAGRHAAHARRIVVERLQYVAVVGRLAVLDVGKVAVDADVPDAVPFGVGLGEHEQLHLRLGEGVLEDLDETKKGLAFDVVAIYLDDDVVLAQAARLGRTIAHHFLDFQIAGRVEQVLVEVEAKRLLLVEAGPFA